MKQYLAEIIVTVLLLALAALLYNPYWMPMGLVLAVLVCFVLALGGFAVFIWRERGGDEREVLIRQVASRVAYLAGAVILAVGIVYQNLTLHAVDPWLLAAFMVVVLAKTAGYAYGKGRY